MRAPIWSFGPIIWETHAGMGEQGQPSQDLQILDHSHLEAPTGAWSWRKLINLAGFVTHCFCNAVISRLLQCFCIHHVDVWHCHEFPSDME